MSPEYKEGDFVVINKIPFFLKRITQGDVIIFSHVNYGLLIKNIDFLMPDGEFFVSGNNEKSLNSNKLGNIPLSAVRGKIILHIRKPESRQI